MSHCHKSSIDTAWFRDRLIERQISQRRLAKTIGIDSSAMSLLLRGLRRITTEEAAAIAEVLKVPLAELVSRSGIAVHDGITQVPIALAMSAEGVVTEISDGGSLAGPRDLPNDAVGIQCRTAMSAAAFVDGWVHIVSRNRRAPESVVGRAALVGLPDGVMMLAKILPGYGEAGTYSLVLGGSRVVLESIPVVWASPVLWIKPA